MELTEDQIEDLKSLVRVAMDMHDYENWENGEYFGDARKFWKGAEIGVDLWVKKMRESQNSSTSDEALHIGSVGGNEVACDHDYKLRSSEYFVDRFVCTKCNRVEGA